MNMLISQIELDSKKSRELIPLECLQCHTTHYRTKNVILSILNGNKKGRGCYCSVECKRKARMSNVIECNCKQCNAKLNRSPSHSKGNVFCNRKCSAIYTNTHKKTITNICINCKTYFKPKRSNRYTKYCSSECKMEYKKQNFSEKIESGKYTSCGSGNPRLKQYLISKRGYKCENCNLSVWKDVPINLTIHHMDGNASNNIPLNLQLLCWNCHSMTKNYGCKNEKSARVYRYT